MAIRDCSGHLVWPCLYAGWNFSETQLGKECFSFHFRVTKWWACHLPWWATPVLNYLNMSKICFLQGWSCLNSTFTHWTLMCLCLQHLSFHQACLPWVIIHVQSLSYSSIIKWFGSFCSLDNSFKTSNCTFSGPFVSTAFNYSRSCFIFYFTADGKPLISSTISSPTSLQTLKRIINRTFLTFLYYLIFHSAYCNGPGLGLRWFLFLICFKIFLTILILFLLTAHWFL